MPSWSEASQNPPYLMCVFGTRKFLTQKQLRKHFTQLNKWSQRFLKIKSDAIGTSQLNPVLATKKKQYTIQTMYTHLSSHKVVVKVNFCSYVLFLFSRIYKLTGVFQTIFNVVITSTPLESSTIICSFSWLSIIASTISQYTTSTSFCYFVNNPGRGYGINKGGLSRCWNKGTSFQCQNWISKNNEKKNNNRRTWKTTIYG